MLPSEFVIGLFSLPLERLRGLVIKLVAAKSLSFGGGPVIEVLPSSVSNKLGVK